MANTVTAVAAPIKGTHMRLVQEDACGVPVTGTGGAVAITKGFVQVVMDPQYEDGVEFFERTADGTLCVNQLDPPTLKRMRLTIDFCNVDPAIAAMITGARLIGLGAPVTGSGFALSEGTPLGRFSLEIWQQVAGSGACDPSGLQRYVYNAWPQIGNPRLGNYTVANSRSTFQVLADTFAPSTLWGDGPGTGTSWLPAGIVAAVTEHWLWNISTNAPPTPIQGTQVLT
jgi:hypothetical protein